MIEERSMRSLVRLALVALLLSSAGCGGCMRGKAPPGRPGAAGGPAISLVPATAPAPNTAAILFQGRSAADWAELLTDPRLTAAKRFEASKALENLGDAGTPYLMDALKNGKTPEVRLAAMEGLTPAGMAKNDKQLVNTFMDMLKDRDATLREQAAVRLAWFDQTEPGRAVAGYMAQDRLMALQATYHFDDNPAVRLAARNSLLSIYDHMRGRLDCPPVQDVIIQQPRR
jgi:hypothetical protein